MKNKELQKALADNQCVFLQHIYDTFIKDNELFFTKKEIIDLSKLDRENRQKTKRGSIFESTKTFINIAPMLYEQEIFNHIFLPSHLARDFIKDIFLYTKDLCENNIFLGELTLSIYAYGKHTMNFVDLSKPRRDSFSTAKYKLIKKECECGNGIAFEVECDFTECVLGETTLITSLNDRLFITKKLENF